MTRLERVQKVLEELGYEHNGMYVEVGTCGNYYLCDDTRQSFAIDEKGKLKYVDDWWLEEYE